MGNSAGAFGSDAVLIYPPFISYFAGPPLGIASLTAALRHRGFSCEAWDVNAEFIGLLARKPGLVTELSSRLERRLSALYVPPALDYHGQREARTLIDALDTLVPLVGPLLASTSTTDDLEIVGDHDKDLPLLVLLQLAAVDAFAASHAPFLESYNAELPPADAVRLARTGKFGAWGDFARERVLPRLLDLRPRLVGFSLMDVTQVLPTLLLAHLVKSALPQTFVVVGGSYASAIKDKLSLLSPCGELVDAFFGFEGETGLAQLVADLAGGRPPGHEVANCALWSAGGYRWNAPRVVENLDELPIPSFDSLDLDIYCRARANVPIPLITSKGCVYGRCTYCTYVYQEPVNRAQSVDKVVTTISALQRRHAVRAFSLKDSLVTTTRARALAESFGRADLDIAWNFQSKISAGFTPALVRLLEDTGCRTIEFGVETPNPRLQKLIRKPAPLEMIETVLGNFAGSRITVIFNMIYGFPTETKDEAEQALEWVSSIPRRHSDVRFASVNHMLGLSRNSGFYTAAADYGIDRVGEWPFAADAEWITPPWHEAFRRKIAKVLHHGGSEMAGQVFTILARERHRRIGKRYAVSALDESLGRAEERIEAIRTEKRMLRTEAAREYAQLAAPLMTDRLLQRTA